MKSQCGMDFQFKNNLTLEEQSFVKTQMDFGEIYLHKDGKYYCDKPEPKGSLFAIAGTIEREMPSILPKFKKFIIHYGECEDDLIQEGKEDGLI